MLVVGLILSIYSLLYRVDPSRDDFGAPPGVVESAPISLVPIVLAVIGGALLLGAIALTLLREKEGQSLVVLLVLATVIRLALAFGFFGTNDVALYYTWPDIVRGGPLYRDVGGYRYHWPPPMILIVTALDVVAHRTGLPLYGLVAIPPTLADLGIGILMFVMAGREGLTGRKRISAAALYLLNPISVLVAGKHIEFGSVPLVFTILAYYAFTFRKNELWAGWWLGMGLAILQVPVLCIPAFVAKVRSWRRRFVFLILTGLPLLIVSLPWLITQFADVVTAYVEKRGEFGIWGTTYLLYEFQTNIWAGPGGGFIGYARAYGAYAMLLLLAALGFAVFPRMKLSHALTFSMLIFFLNPTGFGIQYIIYLLPFACVELENRTGLWYTVLGSIFALTIYMGGILYPWLLERMPVWPNPTRLLSLPIWAWCVWEVCRRMVLHLRAYPLQLHWPRRQPAVGSKV